MASAIDFTAGQILNPGQISGAGDRLAMYLKIFSGEVLASFEEGRALVGMFQEKLIESGKSAQFPVTGRTSASLHTPGNQILPVTIKNAERVIPVDTPIVASTFIHDWDKKVAHYSFEPIFSRELGLALAKLYNEYLHIELANASHATKVIDDADQYDGTWIASDKFALSGVGSSATIEEQVETLVSSIYQAKQTFEERDVDGPYYCCVRPREYNNLIRAVQTNGFSLANSDYSRNPSDVSAGQLGNIGGVQIIMANHMPSVNTGTTGNYVVHNRDMSKHVASIFNKDAIGVLRLMGMKVEPYRKPDYLAMQIIASMAIGVGILRPECSINLELDTLSN